MIWYASSDILVPGTAFLKFASQAEPVGCDDGFLALSASHSTHVRDSRLDFFWFVACFAAFSLSFSRHGYVFHVHLTAKVHSAPAAAFYRYVDHDDDCLAAPANPRD